MPARVALAGLLMVWSALAPAQYSRRSLEGRVTDAGGHPLEGAVVQLKNTRTLAIRSYITRQEGRYRFFGLSTEVDYRVVARYGRVFSRAKVLSSFDSRRQAVIDLKIPTRE